MDRDGETWLVDRFGEPIKVPNLPTSLTRAEWKMGIAGLALTVFGIGEGTFVSLLPLMGVQLSMTVLILLVGISALCMLSGIGIIIYLAIEQFTGVRWPLREWIRQPSIWFLGLILLALTSLIAWGSAHIHQLQSTVDALGFRHLSDPQKSVLKASFGAGPDISQRIWLVSYPECFECRAYAWEFATTFNTIPSWKDKSIGVQPFPSDSRLQLSTLWRGIIVGANDPQHLSDDQRIVVNALTAAHLTYSFEPIKWVDQRGPTPIEVPVILFAPQKD